MVTKSGNTSDEGVWAIAEDTHRGIVAPAASQAWINAEPVSPCYDAPIDPKNAHTNTHPEAQ